MNKLEGQAIATPSELGIDLEADINIYPGTTPELVKVGEDGATEQHICQNGADYTFFQIDYKNGNEVRASRMIAIILPNNRTDLAYWTKMAPQAVLKVHSGKGKFIVGDSDSGDTEQVEIDCENNTVVLPPGRFYTIQCADQSAESAEEPLVISGLYDSGFIWDTAEITLIPGQDVISVSGKTIKVPDSFKNIFADE